MAALIGGLFSALVQWLQLFDIEVFPLWLAIVYDDPALRSRPFASLAQANHQTTYLALAALASLYLGTRTRRDWLVPPALFALATGLALTGSRMSVVFLVVVAVALFARTALRPASLRWRWASMSMLAAGYAVGLIAVYLL